MSNLGAYNYIKNTFKQEYKFRPVIYKSRLTEWNKEPTVIRISKPTNLGRARQLGYKSKTGVIIIRIRIKKGRRKRRAPDGGRKPSKNGRFFSMTKSLQSMAEDKAERKFTNHEVLNSYYVGETGNTKYYEIILLNKQLKTIQNDKFYKQIVFQTKRAARGLTHSGRKHRGYAK